MTRRTGHIRRNGVIGKVCSVCHEWLPLAAYSKDCRRWDGLKLACRDCRSLEHKSYRAENADKDAARHRLYNAQHSEEANARQRRWQKEHPEESRMQLARWRNGHIQAARLQSHRRRARLENALGIAYTTAQHIQDRWAMWGGRCWICGAPATETDHVKPLTAGGAHLPCNLRPICKSCNSTKKNKWPFYADLRPSSSLAITYLSNEDARLFMPLD